MNYFFKKNAEVIKEEETKVVETETEDDETETKVVETKTEEKKENEENKTYCFTHEQFVAAISSASDSIVERIVNRKQILLFETVRSLLINPYQINKLQELSNYLMFSCPLEQPKPNEQRFVYDAEVYHQKYQDLLKILSLLEKFKISPDDIESCLSEWLVRARFVFAYAETISTFEIETREDSLQDIIMTINDCYRNGKPIDPRYNRDIAHCNCKMKELEKLRTTYDYFIFLTRESNNLGNIIDLLIKEGICQKRYTYSSDVLHREMKNYFNE